MPRSTAGNPTELELRILKALWQESPMRVREIRQALADDGHEIAHTTVVTMLNIMVEKGFVHRKQVKNAFLFEPRVTQKQISDGMLGDVVERVFDGSAMAVVLSLFERHDLDPDELKELKRMVNRKAKKQ